MVASAAQGRIGWQVTISDSGEVTDLEGESGRRRAAARRHPRLLVKHDSNTDLFKFFAACDPRAIFQMLRARYRMRRLAKRRMGFTFGPGIPEKRWLRSR